MLARDRSLFAVARGWRDNPLFKNEAFTRGEAWLYLIENAAFQPTKFDSNGRVITIERGQLATSVRRLAADWKWSKSAVDRFLTRLKTGTGDGPMIGTDTGTGQLLITICKYNEYQFKGRKAGTASGTGSGTPTGTAAGQQRDTKEECKEGREEEPNGSSTPQPPQGVRRPDGVSEEAWRDWKRVRKGPITASVLKRMETEAAKVGWTLAQAVNEAAESGWQGFKAEYVKDKADDRQHSRHERSTTRETGERVAARFAAGSSRPADVVPFLGPPRRNE